MAARVGVVLFPGSNCEQDVAEAVRALGGEAEVVWHGDQALPALDAVVVPGGFAHGDYLRPGAIARFSPIMAAVGRFAAEGGPVVGICNGFQVLTEAGLLPGALQKNAGLKFVCRTVELDVASTRSVLTAEAPVATWSASCPIPNGRPTPSWAPRTAGCCSDRFWRAQRPPSERGPGEGPEPGQRPRLMPASFRVAASTPTSRQAAYEMPLRSP